MYVFPYLNFLHLLEKRGCQYLKDSYTYKILVCIDGYARQLVGEQSLLRWKTFLGTCNIRHVHSDRWDRSWEFWLKEGSIEKGQNRRHLSPFYVQLTGSSMAKAQYFYNVKNGSSNITSKSSSKNLSNENIHTLCFQRIGILDHVLS